MKLKENCKGIKCVWFPLNLLFNPSSSHTPFCVPVINNWSIMELYISICVSVYRVLCYYRNMLSVCVHTLLVFVLIFRLDARIEWQRRTHPNTHTNSEYIENTLNWKDCGAYFVGGWWTERGVWYTIQCIHESFYTECGRDTAVCTECTVYNSRTSSRFPYFLVIFYSNLCALFAAQSCYGLPANMSTLDKHTNTNTNTYITNSGRRQYNHSGA